MTVANVNAGKWDESQWNTAVWGGNPDTIGTWKSVYGGGYYATAAMRVRSKSGSVSWSGTSYLLEQGGVL
jgi:hypothetical protein